MDNGVLYYKTLVDQDVNLKVLTGKTELWTTQQTGKVTDEGRSLFQNKLAVGKNKPFFQAIIRNVNLSDSTLEWKLTGAILVRAFVKNIRHCFFYSVECPR